MYAEYPSPIINITNHILTDKDLGDFNNLHIMHCQKYMAILQPFLITCVLYWIFSNFCYDH